MATLNRTFAKALAGGVFFAAACLPLSAQTVDLGIATVDVNDNGGGGLGIDATVGDAVDANVGLGSADRSGGLGVDVDASVGGRDGINADADVDIGGRSGLDADVTASVGGRDGVNANVGVGVDDGVDIGVDVGIGRGVTGGGVGGGTGGTGGIPPIAGGDEDVAPPVAGTPNPPSIAGRGVDAADMARYARRCQEISRNAANYDADLVALCSMVRSAAR